MAQFINEREEEPTTDFVEEAEEQPTQDEVPEEPPVQEQEEDDLPEKYKGKSTKDIIRMHEEAEKLIGRQSQEVGELRRTVDDFIQSQTVEKQARTVLDDFKEEDFFENPKETIEKLIANHPALQQSAKTSEELKKQTTLATLKAQHPDYTDIVQDQEFLQWCGNSKIRTRLLKDANDKYDYDSADELFTLWKERKAVTKDALKVEKEQRKKQIKSASSGSAQGSGEPRPRKVYRRADIIELMRKDPSRYAELAPDIRRAYAEGRVK